uniref:peptidyl-tRNA hydrolase n=1 Tax=Rhizophora mucronata TaxID=61149 RepID=A0A2P2N1U4_RHIMU
MAALVSSCRFAASQLHQLYHHNQQSSVPKIRVRDLCIPYRLFVTTRKRTKLGGLNSMTQTASESESAAGLPNCETDGVKGDGSSDVLVQYVVLRRDLIDTWPLGSVVTQGCHASVAAIWAHRDDPHTLRYCSPESIESMHKVTLEVKGEPQILNLSEKLVAGGIDHKLWIEQPENIPTCLATKPYPKSIASLFFKKLKLCK